jgi:hypothetical protein
VDATTPETPVEDAADGDVLVHLHVSPRASRTKVAGLHGGRVKLAVAAPPVDGAANKEIVGFLARALSVGRDAVTLTAGASGKRKTVRVVGASVADVRRALGLPEA